jgi:hypothetical protein
MEIGRDEMELLKRGVAALEKLASDPVVEIEAGEPLCPNCGEFDPEIKIDPDVVYGGAGRLSEFIIEATCSKCGNTMYGLCDSFNMHQSLETVAQVIEDRRAENVQDV